MLSKADSVIKTFTLIETGYLKQAGAGLTDEFTCTGFMPVETLNKRQFLGLMQSLINAMPDWAYHIRDIKANGDRIIFTTHITATQTMKLRLPDLGLDYLPATGAQIVMPEEPMEAVMQDNNIAKLRIEPVAGGGLAGLLRKLGIELRVAAPV